MNRVFLSIGSNENAAHYIAQALNALQQRFGELQVSSVFESEAIGFAGGNFLNLVVAFSTSEQLLALIGFLKRLEAEHGRVPNQPRFSARTLDVDILLFGDLVGTHEGITLPRAEVTENAYVLWPLSEISGDLEHPHQHVSYQQLWRNYDKQSQHLWPVDFVWNGRQISFAEQSAS